MLFATGLGVAVGLPVADIRRSPLLLRVVGCPPARAYQWRPDNPQGWASYKPQGRKPRSQQRPACKPNSCWAMVI